jgi:hypothetical protein
VTLPIQGNLPVKAVVSIEPDWLLSLFLSGAHFSAAKFGFFTIHVLKSIQIRMAAISITLSQLSK